MKGYCLIYILLTLIFSCSEARKELIDIEIDNNPVQIKVEENVLADNSILVIKPFAVRKPTRVIVGNPTITSTFTNISPAGKPIVVHGKIPEKIIPGLHGNKLPEANSAIIRKVRALNTPLKKALPPWAINGINNTFETIDIEQGLPSSNTLTIFQDSRKNFWIGTSGEGIIKYDGINFLQFTSNEGLPNNWVRAILEDKSGNISIGTTEELQYFDRTTGSFPCLQPANKSNWKTRPLMI